MTKAKHGKGISILPFKQWGKAYFMIWYQITKTVILGWVREEESYKQKYQIYEIEMQQLLQMKNSHV